MTLESGQSPTIPDKTIQDNAMQCNAIGNDTTPLVAMMIIIMIIMIAFHRWEAMPACLPACLPGETKQSLGRSARKRDPVPVDRQPCPDGTYGPEQTVRVNRAESAGGRRGGPG